MGLSRVSRSVAGCSTVPSKIPGVPAARTGPGEDAGSGALSPCSATEDPSISRTWPTIDGEVRLTEGPPGILHRLP